MGEGAPSKSSAETKLVLPTKGLELPGGLC